MFNLLKIFSSNSNESEIVELQKLVDDINAIESHYASLDDEVLSSQTDLLIEKYKNRQNLDEILIDAFAVVRETSKRILEMRHFDVQLMGGVSLHQGKISEMRTGEGKTLIATLAVYLNSLSKKGVHVVTVNDYLAKRDALWMGKIYKFLGLTVGCIQNGGSMTLEYETDSSNLTLIDCQRSEAYKSDVVYGTNNEFGFDYLRDNMAQTYEEKVQRDLNFAIVDEVDNILIDEARTPLIISGPAPDKTQDYKRFAMIVSKLNNDTDYQLDPKRQSIAINETAIDKIESILKIDNLYAEENQIYSHLIDNAIKANEFYKKDQQYVVRDSEIIIVDEFTGRLMEGRRYSDGLHQAIEAKESVEIRRESITYATITLQNYFRLYKKLSGMTGTAVTEAEEFQKIYKLDVIEIPTNKPSKRADLPDQIFMTENAKWNAVANKIEELNKDRVPVLVGTTTIEKSELLSKILRSKNIKCNILNAKQHESEALIISEAGSSGSVTVSTNMAGRGTDIILGGNPEKFNNSDEWDIAHDQVIETGGLYVIGTERHESRRIDNQLRGRSGRQGDPGTTQFYISTDDSLVKRFGGDRIKAAMSAFKWDENEAVENKMISRSIESAQTKVEAFHFEIRKTLVDYDDVMNTQRDVIYKLRSKALLEFDLSEDVLEFVTEMINENTNSLDINDEMEKINRIAFLRNFFPEDNIKKIIEEKDLSTNILIEESKKIYRDRQNMLTEEISKKLDSQIFLNAIDLRWVEHLTMMDNMRQSIGLEAVGQRDPLIQYKKIGFDMFTDLITNIKTQIASDAIRISTIQKNRINQNKYKTIKQNFQYEQTKNNMQNASNSSSNDSNLSRRDRRKLERMNKKRMKKSV